MNNQGLGTLVNSYGSGEYCTPELHVYPKVYAGSPESANAFFSHCICGKKRKVTTVTEVDVKPTPPIQLYEHKGGLK